MPANLTPQYRRAEVAYRQADSPQTELECLQRMLREIPKHKGTDKLQGDLKAKIAKLKLELQKPSSPAASKSLASRFPKQGAGRVLLLGAPNGGKSQLLAVLTRAQPQIAPYPFTTQTPLPGMMAYEDCWFQLIDLPPIAVDHVSLTTMELVRGSDLVLLVVDLSRDDLVDETAIVLETFANSKTRLGRATQLDESDIGVSITHTLVLLNKIDCDGARERIALLDEFLPLPLDRLEISALAGTGLEDLRRQVFERLQIVRVYTKHPNEKFPDLTHPFTIRNGQTL
ncbi:MAG: 50S ribosome-binding GTPase, partial [Planctomycetales bacterium]|nr:50S ribosome-binding GTPase [Planctomycetales bacterium]